MARADSSHAAGQNLAALLHELREDVGAFVVDHVDFLDTKLADFLLAEILALAARPTTWPARSTGTTFTAPASTTTGATFTATTSTTTLAMFTRSSGSGSLYWFLFV
ncbi:MAG TPA: hypothetical protein VII25_08000 [Candidatus Acidoferrum sp.]